MPKEETRIAGADRLRTHRYAGAGPDITSTHEHRQTAEIDSAAVREILDKHAANPGGLIPVLQQTQAAYGYLPTGALEEIASARDVPLASVYGVVTFFTQLRLEPRGRTEIKVCHGTACYVSGATEVTDALCRELHVTEGGTTADGEFTLESVACLGCCGLAPVMMLGETAHGKLTPERALKAVSKAERS